MNNILKFIGLFLFGPIPLSIWLSVLINPNMNSYGTYFIHLLIVTFEFSCYKLKIHPFRKGNYVLKGYLFYLALNIIISISMILFGFLNIGATS
jgi:hypothetical protein